MWSFVVYVNICGDTHKNWPLCLTQLRLISNQPGVHTLQPHTLIYGKFTDLLSLALRFSMTLLGVMLPAAVRHFFSSTSQSSESSIYPPLWLVTVWISIGWLPLLRPRRQLSPNWYCSWLCAELRLLRLVISQVLQLLANFPWIRSCSVVWWYGSRTTSLSQNIVCWPPELHLAVCLFSLNATLPGNVLSLSFYDDYCATKFVNVRLTC